MTEIFSELDSLLRGKRFGILGVGNVIRGDDGVGPEVVARLEGKVEYPIVDASEVPENYSSWIIRSELEAVVFIDAIDFGGTPGEIRIVPVEDLMVSASSTHRLSLHFMIKYLLEEWEGEAVLIGVQPVSLALDNGLSEEVERSVELLKEFFISLSKS